MNATVWGLLIALAACSSPATPNETPRSVPPTASASGSSADPATGSAASQEDLLKQDMVVLCGAARATGGKVFMDVGPYIAEHMKSSYKLALFADIRTTSLDEIIERMRKLMTTANVKQCETVDVLIANDPRKREP